MGQRKLDQRKATLTDYGVSETKSGDLQVFMQFDVEGEDEDLNVFKKMTYFGSLKGAAMPFTLDALAAVGYKGKDMSDLVEGVDGGALKLGVAVSVAVGNNEYNGTVTRKIAFVNAPGSSVKHADPLTAKAKLRALGMDAELAKYRSAAGVSGASGHGAKPADTFDIPY